MRSLTILPLLALALVACGDKAPEATTDDTTTVAAAVPEVQTPHVMGFEAGRALDSLGNVLGGVSARYAGTDTIFVSVRTQYVTPGAKIEAVLLQGTSKAATDQGVVGEADAKNGVAIVPIRFARATPWAKGSYQIEVFLDGVSQGLKPIDIE
jgi:hypothetical protein